MAKLIIKTQGNSLQVGDSVYQKGRLTFTATSEGVIYGGQRFKYQDVECNGVVQSSAEDLHNWLKDNTFMDGGGSGGSGIQSVTGTLVDNTDPKNPIIENPLDEFHQIIVVDEGTRDITDFKGTLCMVKSSLETVDSMTLKWNSLDRKTEKLTLIFTFDCDNVINDSNDECKLSRLPSSVKENDVWQVVYEQFYNSWTLESLNVGIPNGNDRDILTWDDKGKPISGVIKPKHLTDIGGQPSFPYGVLAGTNLNGADPMLLFTEATVSGGSPKAGTFVMYTTGGRLPVSNGTANNEAVNFSQLPKASTVTPSATGTANIGNSLDYARANHVHALGVPTETVRGGVLRQQAIPDLSGDEPIDISDYNNLLAALRAAGILAQ